MKLSLYRGKQAGQSEEKAMSAHADTLMCASTGCMAALQAEHFLQVHGAADLDAGKVTTDKAAGRALDNGPAKPMENGAVHQNGGPQLVAAL